MDMLQRMVEAEVLAPLDFHFARTLERLCPDQDPAVLIGAALASRAVAQGHVCVDLRAIVDRPLVDGSGRPLTDVELPRLFEWVMALGQTPLCSDGSSPAPLVFDGEARLYLTRYFRYQRTLAEDLTKRASAPVKDLDPAVMAPAFARLFPTEGPRAPDVRQRFAGAVALLRRLAVISGGPGTGKTTTVARVLALLVEQALSSGDPVPRIVLLAPTGKAAARLAESLTSGAEGLDCDDAVRSAIVAETSTIHRRLGYRRGSPTSFFHDASNPLPADIVLVDEASMVDLALMSKLVRAIPDSARLVLLGDKDQLASVEAGAILGDICNTGGPVAYGRALLDAAGKLMGDAPDLPRRSDDRTGIWDCVVELTRSFRFRSDGGIGRLARAINAGRGSDAVAQLHEDDAQVNLQRLEEESQVRSILRRDVLPAFEPFIRAPTPAERLRALGDYRLLAAHRRGPFGAVGLNELVEELLSAAGLIDTGDPWYDGRPILITANDYQLELFNGDIGVLHRDESSGQVRAYFGGADGELRSLAPSRLPPHESVYAMTVHKSQGSEFTRIGLVVPPAVSPILTRELLYTGVTRAREHVTLYGSDSVLNEAISRRIDRASGLREALWGC